MIENKHKWMQISDGINVRGVKDVFFISMGGVSKHEDDAKVIFSNVVVQRCIVNLIRNSIEYVSNKDYKRFTQSLKKVNRAPSLKAVKKAFETFGGSIQERLMYGKGIHHVEQLFDYGPAIRKVMYTTNAIESVIFKSA